MQKAFARLVTEYAFVPLVIEADESHLLYVGVADHLTNEEPALTGAASPVIAETVKQLDQYAAGTRLQFDLPYHLIGTDFQKKVWQALTTIDFGERCRYGELAGAIGCPGGARAVGQAAGRNPLLIVIPCHRLVGSRGRLGGFAAGVGLKSRLLMHEKALTQQSPGPAARPVKQPAAGGKSGYS